MGRLLVCRNVAERFPQFGHDYYRYRYRYLYRLMSQSARGRTWNPSQTTREKRHKPHVDNFCFPLVFHMPMWKSRRHKVHVESVDGP